MLRKLLVLTFLILATPGTTRASEPVTFKSSSTYALKPVHLTGELKVPGNATKYPVVILLHGCAGASGINKKTLRAHTKALNGAGFATLILDSFRPRGISGGWVCDRDSRLISAIHYRQRDVRDAIKHMEQIPSIDANNVFLMGQSNGGSVAMIMAGKNKNGAIRAAVAYYPWCGFLMNRSNTPLLVFAGEKDDWTPPEDCINRNNPRQGVSIHVYQDTTHSFDFDIPETVYKGHRLKGNAKATRDSRQKMVRFFKKHLK
ncbi:MAG: dienelactone hydrolase family protein [Pseudomonadota bacterium]